MKVEPLWRKVDLLIPVRPYGTRQQSCRLRRLRFHLLGLRTTRKYTSCLLLAILRKDIHFLILHASAFFPFFSSAIGFNKVIRQVASQLNSQKNRFWFLVLCRHVRLAKTVPKTEERLRKERIESQVNLR